MRQMIELPEDLAVDRIDQPEVAERMRHSLAPKALPTLLEPNPRRYGILAALEPGQHIAVKLSYFAQTALRAQISFPGEIDCATAQLMAGSIWPEIDFMMDEADPACGAADYAMSPFMPRPVIFEQSGDPVIMPHDPASWPWRIGDALKLLKTARGAIRISIVAPWNMNAVTRRIDEMSRQVQIAQLRQPASPLVEHRLTLIAMLRHEARPVELRVECSDNLDRAQRTLLALLLFGEPEAEQSSHCGTLCPEYRLPAALIPSRLHDQEADTDRGQPHQPGQLTLGVTQMGAALGLAHTDRMRHLYVLGGTGTGKSTLMRRLILKDIRAGEGVILIDPHGDLASEVLDAMPEARQPDLVIANAAKGTLGLPLLPRTGDALSIERAVDALVSLFIETLYGNNRGAFGPIFEQYFRNAFTLLALAPPAERRLDNMARVFEDRDFRRGLLADCPDPRCVSFWRKTAEQTGGDWSFANMTAYVTSKLTRLTGGDIARRVFSGLAPALDLEGALNHGKVLIVQCGKGELGEGLSRLVTAAMLMRLRQAAMARSDRNNRRPVRVYIDEFQGARGSELGIMLAEGRKYGLCLTLANQSIGQLGGVEPGSLGSAVLANAGNIALFRLGGPDAMVLAPWLGGDVGWRELCRQPDFHFTARLLQHGRPEVHVDLCAPPEENA